MMQGMKPHPSMPLPSDLWEAPTNALVAQLRARKAGSTAPRLNQPFPDFMLPDTQGRHVSLADLIGRGPLVLSFLRGRWCPYCARELADWHDALPQLEAQGGRFVAVSAETGGLADRFREEIAPGAQMLCDVDHGLAMLLGLAFPIGDDLHRRYVDAGLDLAAIFGNSGRILPITATYVIDRNGIVRYAFADPDFRVRADPAVVIAAVEALRRTP
ncbi:peroxiredoxin-like family protein [Blastomonas sp. SL216]|uniref:peroxiredoxin-like family protein n=1 Tax=Blastomonas sp. SL216 TaxID=2995169 RepID=UPI002377172F|nr:peroxiredoxin-like family protein [Blastomonas sp. SL216]